MSATRYFIRPHPPVRALVISTLTTLVGAVLLVLSLWQGWTIIVTILAVLLLLAGAGLAGAAIWAMRRQFVTLTLDDEGYHLMGAGQQYRGLWADVTRVAQNETGDRLVIYQGQARTHLVFASGDKQLVADIIADLKDRLPY